jgi:hypothetical protein
MALADGYPGSEAPNHRGHAGFVHRRRFYDDDPDRFSARVAKGQQEVGHAGGEGIIFWEDCTASTVRA